MAFLKRFPTIKVNHIFRDVVSTQPHLQYQCELAAAGLLDNPNARGTLFDRRTSLRAYRSRFDDLKPVGKSSLSLGVTGYCYAHQSSGDIYVAYTKSTSMLHFFRPPSVSGSRPMKTWCFPLTFQPGQFVIHRPLDLIVIPDPT